MRGEDGLMSSLHLWFQGFLSKPLTPSVGVLRGHRVVTESTTCPLAASSPTHQTLLRCCSYHVRSFAMSVCLFSRWNVKPFVYSSAFRRGG